MPQSPLISLHLELEDSNNGGSARQGKSHAFRRMRSMQSPVNVLDEAFVSLPSSNLTLGLRMDALDPMNVLEGVMLNLFIVQ